jgi:hypothetical protein
MRSSQFLAFPILDRTGIRIVVSRSPAPARIRLNMRPLNCYRGTGSCIDSSSWWQPASRACSDMPPLILQTGSDWPRSQGRSSGEGFIGSGAMRAHIRATSTLPCSSMPSFTPSHRISIPREGYNQSSPASRPIRVTLDHCEPRNDETAGQRDRLCL